MTAEDERHGWWGAPAAKTWICPKCGETSPVADWKEREIECDTCGDHNARECPKCGHYFDHVWDGERIKAGKDTSP